MSRRPDGLTRRQLLVAAGGLAGVTGAGSWLSGCGSGGTTSVAVARAERYDGSLVPALREALQAIGFGPPRVRDLSVLLKPNLVEPSPGAPHVNTHPQLVRAVAELFRSWDAREVFVAEGQGHERDSFLVLEQSGFEEMLAADRLEFVDLNHDDVVARPNRLGRTRLSQLWLPRTLERADLVVSLPKLKTHHWVGVTLSLKNLFGLMPGICYGWPKNLLHTVGISEAILDIAAAVGPQLAIVDGIVGMEGDGPIMGTPKPMHLLVAGESLTAVDATCARLMGFDPLHIPYLAAAPAAGLGPIAERAIEQRGEPIGPLADPFATVDHPLMRRFRP